MSKSFNVYYSPDKTFCATSIKFNGKEYPSKNFDDYDIETACYDAPKGVSGTSYYIKTVDKKTGAKHNTFFTFPPFNVNTS